MDITSISEQMTILRERIKKLRLQKGVSQLELSSRSGLSQSFLASLESGKKLPSVLTLLRIAGALNLDPRDFFPPSVPRQQGQDKTRIKEEIIRLVEKL